MKRLYTNRKFLYFLVLLLFGGAVLWAAIQGIKISGSPLSESVEDQPELEETIEQAIRLAIDAETPNVLALMLYDTHIEEIKLSKDGMWATAWMVPYDPETGEQVASEPGLVLVGETEDGWKVFLPSDPLWSLVVQQIPDDLISPEQKGQWAQQAEFQASAVTKPLTGYYLPYAGGTIMRLTQSVGHDRYTPSGTAHYAFDFAKPYPSTMFDVHAAKGGIVKRAVWSNENGNPSRSNYIVLEDPTTTPTSYQLYMHFAKDSIPPTLRVVGAPVQRGAFIGVADDTGVSSGHHLHFMVHTTSYSYWGTSVDIQFMDVPINGGRPRIASDLPYCKSRDVCDTTQVEYVSGNFLVPDHIKPSGSITSPTQGTQVYSSTLQIQGWADDDNSGIAHIQIRALYDGEWHNVGDPILKKDFSYRWDMCTDGVPDGPVSLALTIRDKAFNTAEGVPGLVHFTKNYECPVEKDTCIPGKYQIAVFADKDYQGECALLNSGTFSQGDRLGDVGDNNVESIMVGEYAQATLYANPGLTSRGETFSRSDASLTDNMIGRNQVSSIIVKTQTSMPSAPKIIWPLDSAVFSFDESLTLSWDNTSGGSEYQIQAISGGKEVLLTPWIPETYWHWSGLKPGWYSWKVRSRNARGVSAWSIRRGFAVTEPKLVSNQLSDPLIVPFTADMETSIDSWEARNWTLAAEANRTISGGFGWKYDVGSDKGYDNGLPNAGMLTSPSIQIPGSGEAYLRFYYQYETENERNHWDQRWVQISGNGGPFENVLQLSSDPMRYWLSSPAISLKDYAGQTIQVRFYFVTLDSTNNHFQGWYIDDVSITSTPPPSCSDSDSSILQAVLVEDGQSRDGVICPGGDVDYYRFNGVEGERIAIHTQAQSIGSSLDTSLTLIDSDGISPLASNDDALQYQQRDSWIYYEIKRTGMYFFQVRAWNHPSAGDLGKTYRVYFHKDNDDPTASFITPKDGGSAVNGIIPLKVEASDSKSSVAVARFYWHSANWQTGKWVYLGEDWDGSDGWDYSFDLSGISSASNIAVFSAVFDWAGNWTGTGVWNLNPPMLYLPIIQK